MTNIHPKQKPQLKIHIQLPILKTNKKNCVASRHDPQRIFQKVNLRRKKLPQSTPPSLPFPFTTSPGYMLFIY